MFLLFTDPSVNEITVITCDDIDNDNWQGLALLATPTTIVIIMSSITIGQFNNIPVPYSRLEMHLPRGRSPGSHMVLQLEGIPTSIGGRGDA
jgi:hypothetical protein